MGVPDAIPSHMKGHSSFVYAYSIGVHRVLAGLSSPPSKGFSPLYMLFVCGYAGDRRAMDALDAIPSHVNGPSRFGIHAVSTYTGYLLVPQTCHPGDALYMSRLRVPLFLHGLFSTHRAGSKVVAYTNCGDQSDLWECSIRGSDMVLNSFPSEW